MAKKLTPLLLSVLFFNLSFSQEENAVFDNELTERLILIGINKFRAENNLDTLDVHEMLKKASIYRAEDMEGEGDGKADTEAARDEVKAQGGTKNADEVAIDLPVVKARKPVKPEEVAYEALKKWDSDRKAKPVLLNAGYVYAGITSRTDKDNKKTYISVIFGSYNTFNSGADKRSQLQVPYSKKNKKMKEPEKNICKNCDKFKDYYGLQKGVSVKDGKIILEYNNLKALKRLLKLSKDGIAVDVVQRKQYENPDYNIVDNNLFSKGIIVSRMNTNKFFKANTAKAAKKGRAPTKYEAVIGKLPKNLTGAYEINLIILQSNRVCRTVTRSYLEEGDMNSTTPFDMLLHPYTDSCLKPPFQPKAESNILTFIVPFEKNKSDYKPADIEPFVNAMNEPDFILEGIYIYAYSSIEGDSAANSVLQKKRGESIVKALQGTNKGQVSTKVMTDDSWDLFLLDMDEAKYDYLTAMKKQDAIKEINTKGLSKDLEPWLGKERFAKIVLDITYDIEGPKEEKYSVINFNRAVKAEDYRMAYKIQRYIEESVKSKKYSESAIDKMEIPKERKNFGLLMNKVVYHYKRTKFVSEDEESELKEIDKLAPGHPYMKYNLLFCDIKLDTLGMDKKKIDDMQKRIDSLYTLSIPKKFVDAMNIEFQFKIIDELDTVEKAQPIIEACIAKVKTFYDTKDASWQNSLKLAYVFARFRDYKYASGLLEPFVKDKSVDEQLLFTYVTICAQMPDKIKSRGFAQAMKLAAEKNPKRYCNLFGEPFLTFQLLDNPFVKEEFNKANCAK